VYPQAIVIVENVSKRSIGIVYPQAIVIVENVSKRGIGIVYPQAIVAVENVSKRSIDGLYCTVRLLWEQGRVLRDFCFLCGGMKI
jgi:hypothetical protein